MVACKCHKLTVNIVGVNINNKDVIKSMAVCKLNISYNIVGVSIDL